MPRLQNQGNRSQRTQSVRRHSAQFYSVQQRNSRSLDRTLNQIVSQVKIALEHTPPELWADVADRGMMLTGGGALINDIDRLLAEETGLPVLIGEDPLTCVVRGSGMALDRMDKLGSLFSHE